MVGNSRRRRAPGALHAGEGGELREAQIASAWGCVGCAWKACEASSSEFQRGESCVFGLWKELVTSHRKPHNA